MTPKTAPILTWSRGSTQCYPNPPCTTTILPPNFHPKNNVFILHITSRPTFFTNTSTTILQIAKLSNLSLKLPSSSSFNHQYHKHHASQPSKSPYLYHQNPHHQNSSLATIFYHHKSPKNHAPLNHLYYLMRASGIAS